MAQRRRIRVLIVNDEKRFRTIAAARFAKHRLEAIGAAGGEEATDEIHRSDIGAVALDARTPGIHENQTACAIEELKPDVEVIMLTVRTADSSAVQASLDQTSADSTTLHDIDYLAEQIRDALDQRDRSVKFCCV